MGNSTSAGRPKSDADDYRYFPEPDLLPVEPSLALIEELRAALPEPPAERRRRLKESLGFTDLEFQDVVTGAPLLRSVDGRCWGITRASTQVVDWRDCQAGQRWFRRSVVAVSPADVAALVALVESGELTTHSLDRFWRVLSRGEGSPSEVVVKRGLKVVSDDGALIAAIDEALAAQPDVLEKIRDGKVQAAGAVIGAVMKAMHGVRRMPRACSRTRP